MKKSRVVLALGLPHVRGWPTDGRQTNDLYVIKAQEGGKPCSNRTKIKVRLLKALMAGEQSGDPLPLDCAQLLARMHRTYLCPDGSSRDQ